MRRLIIWRHGQTAWNLGNRIQGQQDVDLDDTGRDQAAAAARMLAAEDADLLVSSDLRRARGTAEALSRLNGLPILTDRRLRERRYGEWEGLTHAQISQRWPEEFARWKAGVPIPECGLEDPVDVAMRVAAALLELADRTAAGTVIVVSHGGSARQGMGAVLDWPPGVVRAVGPLANCHWTELRGGPHGWRLHAHNVGPRAGVPAGGTPDEPPASTESVAAPTGTVAASGASERV